MQKRTLGLKLIAGTLVLSLSISSVPSFRDMQSVHAATSENDFGFDATTGRITAYKGSDQNVSIPNTINSISVKGIEWGAFFSNSNVTQVSLPDTATTTGAMAFEACTGLTSASIPSGTTVIAPYAYYGCSGLRSVSIPSSVQTIMLEAFGGCSGLTTVTIPEGVTAIEMEAFKGCTSLTKIELPASLTTIGADVFKDCNSSLTIAAPAGSYAATYASQSGIQFEETGNAENEQNQQINQTYANAVISKIDAIGTVTLSSEAAIISARNAYDALTDVQKALVTNYNTLTQAEATLATLKDSAAENEANQAAADSVITLIAQIGTVTLNSEAAITSARNAYDALTDAQKVLVTNYSTLTQAENDYATLKAQYEQAGSQDQANQIAAKAVIDSINNIGTVTLTSEYAITSARNAYDNLTEAQKALVTNYNTLTQAEDTLAKLKEDLAAKEEADLLAAATVVAKINSIGTVTLEKASAITDARDSFNALTLAQQSLVSNYDTLVLAEHNLSQLQGEADLFAALAVTKEIAGIGTVTLAKENIILAARRSYDALTANQKAIVSNYDTLTAAENTLAVLKAAEEEKAAAAAKDQAAAALVTGSIAQLGTITLNSEAAITSARTAYNALTNAQKALVTNYSVLTTAETTLAQLKAAQSNKVPTPSVTTTLTLNQTAHTLYTKGSKTVTLTAMANGTALAASNVVWTSSNSKVATVKAGKVTAKKKGTVTITATYNGVSTKATITVKKPTLKLKKTKATIKVKKKFKIRATAKPAKKITYKSGNKKVATVSKKGVITGKSAGKTTIRVKANGVTKKFKITVK